MKIALIRHGQTEWNAAGRVQGTVETSLSEIGRAEMAKLLPPAGFENARPFVSPQLRARETAQLLGLRNPTIDARLREQDWGEWEGLTRAGMLEKSGADAFERAGSGFQFRPPGGEAAFEVRARIESFFVEVASGSDAVAVCHMGILRTAFAIASGWDLIQPMPAELDLKAALVLSLDADGAATIANMNAPLRIRSP